MHDHTQDALREAERMTREQAITQLSRSERGRNAIRTLLAWLDDDGLSLDSSNQDAVLSLLVAAWHQPGSTRDLMRDAITEELQLR